VGRTFLLLKSILKPFIFSDEGTKNKLLIIKVESYKGVTCSEKRRFLNILLRSIFTHHNHSAKWSSSTFNLNVVW